MRAVCYETFGPPQVSVLREVPVPTPARGELLVRVHAAALNPKDVLLRKGKFRLLAGRGFPRAMGFDWCGTVERVGAGVPDEREGERLFGMINGFRGGALADYVVVRHDEAAPAPASLDDAGAAALPLVSLTALQALRDLAGLQPGMAVLVHGASGGVGTAALQIARALGARVVSTSSEANLALCRSLGAEVALDYRAGDVLAGPERYDAIFDAFGNLGFARARRALARRGTYVGTIPSVRILADALRTRLSTRRARLVVVRSRRADLEAIAELVERGALRPVLDGVYPLAAFREAQERQETRRARGKVVVRID